MTDPIERVVVTHLQIPFKEPFRIAARPVMVQDALVIALETRAGRVGWGECSPRAAGFGDSPETPAGCWSDLVERIAPGLLGQVFATTDDIAAVAGGWSGSRCAVAGAETACWDLLGQATHASLAELLGAAGDRIAAGLASGLTVGLYPTIVELLQVIETHLAEGYKRIKIKIEPGRDLELVDAVRQHFGAIPLMVEANAAYTRADLALFRILDAYDLLMFEQPFAADDLDGLAALQAEVATPVCLDETADTLARTAAAIRRGACRIVNLKLQRVGGFGPALAMHDLCQHHEVACWVGTMPELGLGQAHGIHLAALPNCKYPTDIAPSARWFVDDYVVPPLELSAPGLLRPPIRPGLGYQADAAKLRRYRVQQREFRAGA
jgi:O-succinylbenzoate synthase